MQLQHAKINFLGDSITEGVGTSGPAHRYVDLMQARYSLLEARNYGIGGTRIAHQLDNDPTMSYNQDFCLRADSMDPDADAVVVFGGTNDYGHGDAPIGCFADRTTETFYGACRVLMEKLICRYPGKPIVVVTPLHRSDVEETSPFGCGKVHPTLPLSGYVDIIREVARYYSLPVLDLFAESGLQPAVPVIRERFMPDGLHPSDAGNEILCEKIAHFLLQMQETKSTETA